MKRVIQQVIKRVIDASVALVTLAVLSPLLALLALLAKGSTGRVFFQQERIGMGGSTFRIVKFCTMTGRRDSAGHLLPDEQRLTALGRWLRRSSLDEVPELVNVLRGDMSLVGPRPLLERYRERFTPQQARRQG